MTTNNDEWLNDEDFEHKRYCATVSIYEDVMG